MVKIDVEGGEIEVIQGMLNTINQLEDVRLFIEFNPKCIRANGHNPVELLDLLQSIGLRIYFIDDENKKVLRYDNDFNWEEFISEKKCCNIYCNKENNALNLLFFSHSSQLAGAERSMFSLIEELISDFGIISTVVLPNDGPLRLKLESLGCVTIVIQYYWWCNENASEKIRVDRQYESYKATSNNCQLLQSISPDFVLTNSIVIPWGALFASEHELPHIWIINEFGEADHGLVFDYNFEKIISFIENYSELIITCSKSVQDQLFGSSEKAKTIYKSLNDSKTKISSAFPRRDFFQLDDAFHLLIVGTVTETKGQLDAINASIELLKNRGKLVELVLVGYLNKEYSEKIKRIVAEKGVADNIRLLPFEENVFPGMLSADAILVCSRNEAFGRVTVEGMLAAKPVIATNTGGTPEIITDGKNGLLYRPGDFLQLADQIQRIIDDPKLLRIIASNGKRFAEKKFSKENYSRIYYNEMVSRKNNQKNGVLNIYRVLLQESLLKNKDATNKSIKDNERINRLRNENKDQKNEIQMYALSKSWRITRPLRKIMKLINRGKND